MFDPSFFELIVICVVALLVLGPDRLPGAIKTLGLWIGRLRRSFNNIKREIEQEVGADEIRRQLRNEAIMEKFKDTKNEITESIDSVKSEAESIKNDLDLKKQLSDFGDDSEKTNSNGDNGDVDPIEKLATNDPTARIIKPATPVDQASTETNSTPVQDDKQSQSSATDNPDDAGEQNKTEQ